jgi:hypothetical protein
MARNAARSFGRRLQVARIGEAGVGRMTDRFGDSAATKDGRFSAGFE